jgi:hypothetical protein
MKSSIPLNERVLIILLLLTLALTGCIRGTIHLKVVDETTEKPLTGVTVKWTESRDRMFDRVLHYGPEDLHDRHTNGIIDVLGMHHGWISCFVISYPSYPDLYAIYDRKTLSFGSKVSFFTEPMDGDFYFTSKWNVALKTNDTFTIPMQK